MISLLSAAAAAAKDQQAPHAPWVLTEVIAPKSLQSRLTAAPNLGLPGGTRIVLWLLSTCFKFFIALI